MKKIAVIFGGKSTEYEISLESASSVISELEKLDFEVLKIGITFEGEWYLFNGDNNWNGNTFFDKNYKVL